MAPLEGGGNNKVMTPLEQEEEKQALQIAKELR